MVVLTSRKRILFSSTSGVHHRKLPYIYTSATLIDSGLRNMCMCIIIYFMVRIFFSEKCLTSAKYIEMVNGAVDEKVYEILNKGNIIYCCSIIF